MPVQSVRMTNTGTVDLTGASVSGEVVTVVGCAPDTNVTKGTKSYYYVNT
jgi:hypothetical protein